MTVLRRCGHRRRVYGTVYDRCRHFIWLIYRLFGRFFAAVYGVYGFFECYPPLFYLVGFREPLKQIALFPPGRLSALYQHQAALLPFTEKPFGRDKKRLMPLYRLVVDTSSFGYLPYGKTLAL